LLQINLQVVQVLLVEDVDIRAVVVEHIVNTSKQVLSKKYIDVINNYILFN
jgi:hypothetical protein